MDRDLGGLPNPRELGRRLQEARVARGRTQQEVAGYLDVARTTITAIEKGERRVRPSELARLAAFYGRSVGELVWREVPAEPFAVQLRASLPTKVPIDAAIDRCFFEFQALCEDYLELERVCATPLPRRYPTAYETGTIAPELVAEDIAGAERKRLGIGDGPLPDLRDLLEHEVGLRVFFMELPGNVSAMVAYADQLGGCVAVNRNHPETRRRMSLSHEYGHFLTNRHQSEVFVNERYQRQPGQERLANAFGRAFLMPASGLIPRFNKLRQARERGPAPADLVTLAHYYWVSLPALVLRLEELRQLPMGTWEKIDASGLEVGTAQRLLHLPDRPTDDHLLPARYRFLAVTAYVRGEISEGRLARYLRCDRVGARLMVEALAPLADAVDQAGMDAIPLDLHGVLDGAGG